MPHEPQVTGPASYVPSFETACGQPIEPRMTLQAQAR